MVDIRLFSSPTNEEESHQYGNALAASGNYPVGLSGCFTVGISGGCGAECYVFRDGKCNCEDIEDSWFEDESLGTEESERLRMIYGRPEAPR